MLNIYKISGIFVYFLEICSSFWKNTISVHVDGQLIFFLSVVGNCFLVLSVVSNIFRASSLVG